ncbi:UNVERIFIED_CONTAM: Cleavage and polyadenylation specificity factor subunit [Sesamum radiatum]|uniref:Cleavage and polyadenylation specificity factor subunit n=1 Tax=Sesamum radiatum TaxID=300843 RepID=A0AAW2JQY6_SESRA
MDPVTGEQLDYGDEEYAGSQKMQYHQGGAIPALAEEEMIGEEDEYDDLYNDVNVGEGFLQMQRSEAQMPSGNYLPTGVQFPEQKTAFPAAGGPAQTVDASQRARLPEMVHNSQPGHLGYQGSVSMPQKTAADRMNKPEKIVGEPAPSPNPNMGSSKSGPQIPTTMMNSSANVNINRPVDDEYLIRPAVENGNTMLFVGELHWWTTDAELESVLIQYGKVKEIKFFDERASGKSKGYCQVEFYDPAAAAACKEGMHGHVFNGRACVVAFATPQTIKQMGSSYMNKNPTQGQSQQPGRNLINDGAGRGNGTNYPSGDTGRNFGRGGWGRGGNQVPNKGPGPGPVRGRGGIGNKNMIGNAPGAGGGAYGQAGLAGPGFGGPPGMMMHPQGMMGPGFDLAFMGRGGGYAGFSGPAFPGMDGPHSGMWHDMNMGGWGGEEHGRGTRESSYGGEDNASEYGYGEASHEKGVRSSAASREKERNSERDWSSNPEKRHREERDHDGDRYERDHKYREEKDRHRDYRHKDRDLGYDDDWDRGQSSRSRSRSRAVPGDDHRSRSRDADYGKKETHAI